jgi:hypothetical protein
MRTKHETTSTDEKADDSLSASEEALVRRLQISLQSCGLIAWNEQPSAIAVVAEEVYREIFRDFCRPS